MSAPECIRCQRPVADQAYACTHCANRAADHLTDLADMTPAARDVAMGLARHSHGGGASGKPGSAIPLDLSATQRLDAVQTTLTTWARHVAGERGIAPGARPLEFGTHGLSDPIVDAAAWLAEHVEWMRHRPEAAEFLADVDACHRVVRGIARGPAEQKYLGPCGALLDVSTPTLSQPERVTEIECPGDVYAYRGAQHGTCRTCGAQVSTADREAWLDGEVRQHAFRAAHIADAYGVNVKTVRTWAARGQLKSYYRTDAGIVADWAEPADGETRERLHYVGDVLDLAAADAARRAEQQARRARRREQATTEGDAA